MPVHSKDHNDQIAAHFCNTFWIGGSSNNSNKPQDVR